MPLSHWDFVSVEESIDKSGESDQVFDQFSLNIESQNAELSEAWKLMLVSPCAVCDQGM